ncbi:MAG: hypothetical protein GXP27_10490 [Planctomycetes bacterium]|nr:hypothetical protein [Planctomycetota bacterium]
MSNSQLPDPAELPELGDLPTPDPDSLKEAFSSARLSPRSEPRIRYQPVRELGTGLSPPLTDPITLTIDANERILVLDRPKPNTFRICRFSPTGDAEGGITMIERGDEDEQLLEPVGLAVDRQFRMYVPDAAAGTVSQFSQDGRWLETFRSAGHEQTPFDCPRDVDLDEDGNLYIADAYNNRVLKLQPDGELIWALERFANPLEGEEEDELFEPSSVCIGSDGVLFVADTNQNRVLGFDSNHKLVWLLHQENLFHFPSEVRLSRDGTAIFVADQGQLRVQRFDRQGQRTGMIVLGRSSDGAVAIGGDIDIDSSGHVVMVDPLRHVVVILRCVEARPI